MPASPARLPASARQTGWAPHRLVAWVSQRKHHRGCHDALVLTEVSFKFLTNSQFNSHAMTSRQQVLTLWTTLTKFFTKILCYHTRARAVARLPRVVTGLIVVNMVGGAVCTDKSTRQSRKPEAATRPTGTRSPRDPSAGGCPRRVHLTLPSTRPPPAKSQGAPRPCHTSVRLPEFSSSQQMASF